ncbi:MAG TPA: ArsR family transcriptional regulator [Anaerolineae bacterium]|nr:ArsR family transcriptional regulator [Anaerolineae bacterium]HIQ05789.1 ArsR family transcriptional regulator [Anaerolineae bacterium]
MLANGPMLAEVTARIAYALAHPVRVQILELLRDEGAYVMHLTAILGRPQANISQHLAVLREAGLVEAKREGMTVIYYVRDPRVFEVIERLEALAESRTETGMTEFYARLPKVHRMKPGGTRRCRCPRCQARK